MWQRIAYTGWLVAIVVAMALSTAPAASAPGPGLVVARSDGGAVGDLKHSVLASQLVMLANAAHHAM